MRFHDLGLSEPILRAVTAEGYVTPTPIQAGSIPDALAGRDIFGCAQTGTGKTCAFALPILQRLGGSENPAGAKQRGLRKGRLPRALVLCPTRELAAQILDSFVAYGRHLPLRYAVIFGGVGQYPQVRALQAGVDVVVATPGRLLDLMNQGVIDLGLIEVLVLDEADRMLDMGFIHDIRRVIASVPKERQTLFYSATVSRDIRRLADTILSEPVYVETAPESTTAEAIAQRVYMVERKNKTQVLERILRRDDVSRALVFTRTKHGADKLVKVLRRVSIQAEAIHGNKSQNARTRAMQGFRNGHTRVLVATDIASRGIDVDEITHVVNFDMPVEPEAYVHRIGRTARAGASGVAVSLCDPEELELLRAIERRTRSRIEVGADMPDVAWEVREDRPRSGGGRGKAAGTQRGRRGASNSSGSARGKGRASGSRAAAEHGRTPAPRSRSRRGGPSRGGRKGGRRGSSPA